jgi:vitamin B12 transporter
VTRLNSESSNAVPSFYISSHARWLANFSTIYRIKGLLLSINGIYKTRASREAAAIHATVSKRYFVMNTKAEYNVLKQHVAVFVQIDNIFNTRYSDLLGSQMPGSWAMGGLRFKWVK